MKKLFFSLLIIFYITSVWAQSQNMKVYLNDGSSKSYNLSDINQISFRSLYQGSNFNIYYDKGVNSTYLVSDIDSVQFSLNSSMNNILKIYLKQNIKTLEIFRIDSINFTFPSLTAPKITSVNPSASQTGQDVSINGSNFGINQGTGFVTFNGLKAQTYSQWSDNKINVQVPAGASNGNIIVTNSNSEQSNSFDFNIIPFITGLSSSKFKVGDDITVNGNSFGSAQDLNFISFGAIKATEYTSWSSTSIKVKVPATASAGKLSVNVAAYKSNEVDFSVIPQISSINPTLIITGGVVTINGSGFGTSKGSSFISFNNLNSTLTNSWSYNQINAIVPQGSTSGNLSITVNGNKSNSIAFTLNLASVVIGNQVWMVKNIEVDHYLNGDSIPQVADPAQWANLTTGAWCYNNNDEANGKIYGKLYNWYAVNDPRGLAPSGWHIPTDKEWKELELSIQMTQASVDSAGWRGSYEAGSLKSTGTIEAGDGLWFGPNARASNETGFTGLPGGLCDPYGAFYDNGRYGDWWTATEFNSNSAWSRSLSYFYANIGRDNVSKLSGLSVRCVR
ncbi:MAG: IPT/TIG domain-containing protein [Candidatus Kapabacteria bacterium]|nr:IPT/TIG domain-containing protein [Candidatus Kapabacteria bacterium]